jgi:GntR family transcriptional regulator/MocR family aminotransferase
VRLVPADLIGRSYRRAIRASGPALLSYNDPAGLPRLRQQLAIMLATTRGLVVNPESIMVTRGSQMALALLARALVRPGDTVAVEQPGYRPAWEAFRLAGAEILPVHVDEHGLDLSALARRIERRPVRAVYVTPHHQFPTTVTLAGPRRLRLLDLAARARFAVIEDDYDHEFHYDGKPVLPLASHDRAGVVAYVGTMSKVLAPGLRLGFIAAPPNLIEQLVAYRSFVDRQGDHVLESAIADLLEDGLIQRHARKMRRLYRARLEALATALGRHLGTFLTFRKPSGGTAIWVRVRSAPSHDQMDARRAGSWGAVRCRPRIHLEGWAGGRCAPRFRQSYGRGTGACGASARCSCEVSPIASRQRAQGRVHRESYVRRRPRPQPRRRSF